MFSKIFAVISLCCILDGLSAQTETFSEEGKQLYFEFLKKLWDVASKIEDSSDKSYPEAKNLLNSEAVEIKGRCRMYRNIEAVRQQQNEYEKVFNSTPYTNIKPPIDNPSEEAIKLMKSLANFFKEISPCYPEKGRYLSSDRNLEYNMVALMLKEIVYRVEFFWELKRGCQEAIPTTCPLHQDQEKILFFQELLMQLSPIIGSCNDHTVQRKYIVDNAKDCNSFVREKLGQILSPIGPPCKIR